MSASLELGLRQDTDTVPLIPLDDLLEKHGDELDEEERNELAYGPYAVYLTSMKLALLLAGIPRALGWHDKIWGRILVMILFIVCVVQSFVGTALWVIPDLETYDPLIFIAHTLMCFQPISAIVFAIWFASLKCPKVLCHLASISKLKLACTKPCKYRIRKRLLKITAALIIIGIPLFVHLAINMHYYASNAVYAFIFSSTMLDITAATNWMLPYHFVVVTLCVLYVHMCICSICVEQLSEFKRMLIRDKDGSFIANAPRLHQQLMSCIREFMQLLQPLLFIEIGIALLIGVALATTLLTGQLDLKSASQLTKIDFYAFCNSALTFGLAFLMGLGGVAWLSTAAQDIIMTSTALFANEVSPMPGDTKSIERIAALRDLMHYLRHSYGADGVLLFGIPMTTGTIMRILSVAGTVMIAILQKISKM